MLDKIIPKKFFYVLDLIRFTKPIGFLLLMWPCWFGLAILPINQYELIIWYLLFFLGAFLMRSAGCIINDLIDINIDKKIDRTKNRPLATEKLSRNEAIMVLILFLLPSFAILLQFNFYTIIFGIAILPLIIIYPLMKRYTHWPQLILGLIFNYGIILISINFLNEINMDYIILYIGCIFWTLSYDTIYAYQDRKDDILSNIKSTAVLFNEKGTIFVKFFYLIFMATIGFLVWKNSGSLLNLTPIVIFIIVYNIFLNKWKPKSRSSSNFYFRFNNLLGLFCFIYLLIF